MMYNVIFLFFFHIKIFIIICINVFKTLFITVLYVMIFDNIHSEKDMWFIGEIFSNR